MEDMLLMQALMLVKKICHVTTTPPANSVPGSTSWIMALVQPVMSPPPARNAPPLTQPSVLSVKSGTTCPQETVKPAPTIASIVLRVRTATVVLMDTLWTRFWG